MSTGMSNFLVSKEKKTEKPVAWQKSTTDSKFHELFHSIKHYNLTIIYNTS
jgi:hypothetical protein